MKTVFKDWEGLRDLGFDFEREKGKGWDLGMSRLCCLIFSPQRSYTIMKTQFDLMRLSTESDY